MNCRVCLIVFVILTTTWSLCKGDQCVSLSFDTAELPINPGTLYCEFGPECRVYLSRFKHAIGMDYCNMDASFLTISRNYTNEITFSVPKTLTRVMQMNMGGDVMWLSLDGEQLVWTSGSTPMGSIPISPSIDNTVTVTIHGDPWKMAASTSNNASLFIQFSPQWQDYPLSAQLLGGAYEFIDFKRTPFTNQQESTFDPYEFIHQYSEDPKLCKVLYQPMLTPNVYAVPKLGYEHTATIDERGRHLNLSAQWIYHCIAMAGDPVDLEDSGFKTWCTEQPDNYTPLFNLTSKHNHTVPLHTEICFTD